MFKASLLQSLYKQGIGRGGGGGGRCSCGGREEEDDTEYKDPGIRNRTAYCEIWWWRVGGHVVQHVGS